MKQNRKLRIGENQHGLDGRLAAYLAAAGAVGVGMVSEAEAIVVANTTVQPFGINGEVSIDFNGDTQIDYQIDHDRINLGGGEIVDYLQVDKNDSTSATNPLAIPGIFETFPVNGNPSNNTFEAKYLTPTSTPGDYPAALTRGEIVGSGASWDFQETDGFGPDTDIIRANRLIDEDAGRVEQVLGGIPLSDIAIPSHGPNFIGLGGEVRYLGVRMQLQTAGPITYGWIGIRITNEDDATGEVVGWAYETSGAPISTGLAVAGDYNENGQVDAADYVVWRNHLGLLDPDATPAQGDGTGDGKVSFADYNYWKDRFGNTSGSGADASAYAVPEPCSILLSGLIGLLLCSRYVWKRILGR
jgi:hypothetical protein